MITTKRPWYKSKLWTVCVFILVVELCERLCYYTFAGSQRNFLMLLGYPASQATSLNAAFSILVCKAEKACVCLSRAHVQ